MGAPIFEPDEVPTKLSEGYAPRKLSSILDINPVKDMGMIPDEKVAIRMPIVINDTFYHYRFINP